MELDADPRVAFLRTTAEVALGTEGALFQALIDEPDAASQLGTFLAGGEGRTWASGSAAHPGALHRPANAPLAAQKRAALHSPPLAPPRPPGPTHARRVCAPAVPPRNPGPGSNSAGGRVSGGARILQLRLLF